MGAVKIPQIEQQTTPSALGISPQAHVPEQPDYIGKALQGLGKTVAEFGETMDAIEKENAIARVRDKIFEDDLKLTKYIKDEAMNMPENPEGWAQKIGDFLVDYRQKALDGEPSAIGKRIYSRALNTMAHSIFKQAVNIEFDGIQKYRISTIDRAIENAAKIAFLDPELERLEQRRQLFLSTLEESQILPEAKRKLAEKYNHIVSTSYLEGLRVNYPERAQELAKEIFGFVENEKGQVKPVTSKSVAVGSQQAQYKPEDVISAVKKAIGIRESNENYDAINPRTRAIGKYQILPSNWPVWAVEAGLPADAKPTPENQEIVTEFKIQQYGKMFNYDPKLIAAAWYSGPNSRAVKALANGDTSNPALHKRYGKNGKEPSVWEYVNAVAKKIDIASDEAIKPSSQEQYTAEVTQVPDNEYIVMDERINGGKPTLIPAISGNRHMSEEEAINEAIASGETFKSFNSVDDAYITLTTPESEIKSADKIKKSHPILQYATAQDLITFAKRVQQIKTASTWVTDPQVKADLYSRVVRNPESVSINEILAAQGKGLTTSDAHFLIGEREKYLKPGKKDEITKQMDKVVLEGFNRARKDGLFGEGVEGEKEYAKQVDAFMRWRAQNPNGDATAYYDAIITPKKKSWIGKLLDSILKSQQRSEALEDYNSEENLAKIEAEYDTPQKRREAIQKYGVEYFSENKPNATIETNKNSEVIKIKNGQTATDPKTGKRILFRDGKIYEIKSGE